MQVPIGAQEARRALAARSYGCMILACQVTVMVPVGGPQEVFQPIRRVSARRRVRGRSRRSGRSGVWFRSSGHGCRRLVRLRGTFRSSCLRIRSASEFGGSMPPRNRMGCRKSHGARPSTDGAPAQSRRSLSTARGSSDHPRPSEYLGGGGAEGGTDILGGSSHAVDPALDDLAWGMGAGVHGVGSRRSGVFKRPDRCGAGVRRATGRARGGRIGRTRCNRAGSNSNRRWTSKSRATGCWRMGTSCRSLTSPIRDRP